METRQSFSNYEDFDNHDNFFTLIDTPNGHVHTVYGHYHPDDETLFVYKNVHNKQVQDASMYVCMGDALLKIKDDVIYRYNNIEDLVFVYDKLRRNR